MSKFTQQDVDRLAKEFVKTHADVSFGRLGPEHIQQEVSKIYNEAQKLGIVPSLLLQHAHARQQEIAVELEAENKGTQYVITTSTLPHDKRFGSMQNLYFIQGATSKHSSY